MVDVSLLFMIILVFLAYLPSPHIDHAHHSTTPMNAHLDTFIGLKTQEDTIVIKLQMVKWSSELMGQHQEPRTDHTRVKDNIKSHS